MEATLEGTRNDILQWHYESIIKMLDKALSVDDDQLRVWLEGLRNRLYEEVTWTS